MDRTRNTFPLYLRIADKIRQQITSGALSINEKLPSQSELAKRFNTTRMTVRQSLRMLEEDYLIKTKHGSGTVVISPNVKEDDFRISGFSNEMEESSLIVDTNLLKANLQVEHPEACQALDLLTGTKLSMLERLRLIEGNPIVLQRSYLPPWLQQIVRDFTPKKSLYDQLSEHANQVVTITREVLQAIVLSEEVAVYLKRKTGDPALLSLRISQNRNGIPVVYDEAIIAGDHFVILTERIGRRATYQFNIYSRKIKSIFDFLLERE